MVSEEMLESFDRRTKYRLILGAVICFTLFWWVGRTFGVPPLRRLGGSLLVPPSSPAGVLVAGVTLVAAALLGKIIVGRHYYEGGLFAATVGLMAFAHRGGPIRYVLFQAGAPEVYLTLASELILLYALLFVAWLATRAVARAMNHTELDLHDRGRSRSAETVGAKLTATGAHAAVMIACMLFLAQSEAKNQALAATGVSAALASLAAFLTFPQRSSVWYWASPLVVGVVGYIVAYFNPAGIAIGFPQGPLAALARPLPLDYASAGTAGAIFGFWAGQHWHHVENAEVDAGHEKSSSARPV